MPPRVRTIQDLELLYYDESVAKEIAKADQPVLSTTTGVYNPVYGAQVWNNLNTEVNAFGVLPKYPWQRSGWRIITGRAYADGAGGVGENAVLPETRKPDWVEVSTKPKTVAHTFEVSEIQQVLAESEDDAIAKMADLRAYFAEEHQHHINVQLLADVDTPAGDNMESIDRVCSSQSEESTFLDAGDSDIYGLDRSASTNYDAYVDFNDDGAGGSQGRQLTDALIREAISNIKKRGGKRPTVILTGYETMSRIQEIYNDNVRISGALRDGDLLAQMGVNGIQTDDGVEAGTRVSTLYGIPVIESKDVVSSGTNLPRMYFLNLEDTKNKGRPDLGISIARPTQYFETGISTTGDPFSRDKFGDEGMYRTMGELVCTNFRTQGKIRDITA